MSNDAAWMIYGATGYTGRLLAREAVARGLRPILAGRSAAAVEALSGELGCPSRVFACGNSTEIAKHLSGIALVMHCAGPFSATAEPMMDACLASRAHYLDITGEIDVIEAGAARDERAKRAGTTLMPAVGFDVVPTDCLAATLAAELRNATHLELAFHATGSLSVGTAKTMVEGLPHGGRVRRDGKIIRVPAAWKSQQIPFRAGPLWAATIPWGDVASAFYSTGIPNIEVYLAMPLSQIRNTRLMRPLLPLAGFSLVQRLLKRAIERRVHGPSAGELETSRSSLWGRVTDATGQTVSATLETPGGYPLTVLTTLAIAERVLAGDYRVGFQTPSRAYGAELILTIPGTDLQLESRVARARATSPI